MKNIKIFLMSRVFVALALCVFAVTFFAAPSYAVLFTETSIEIGPNQRVATLTVKNSTNKSQVYRFVWNEMGFNEEGKLRKLDDGQEVEGLRSAAPYIRFAPQRIRMAPGQVQQVRFLVRRTGSMADGEYRSYFSLVSEPIVNPFEEAQNNPTRGAYAETGLQMNVGWRIPLLLRHGQTEAKGTILSAERAKRGDKDVVSFNIAREGNISLLGRVRLLCQSDGGKEVGEANYRIYTEQDQREGFVVLQDAACKELDLQFVSNLDDPVFRGKIVDTFRVQ